MTDDDPECTDCGGTGTTYQTERRCACQGPAPKPSVSAKSELKDFMNNRKSGDVMFLDADRVQAIIDEIAEADNSFHIINELYKSSEATRDAQQEALESIMMAQKEERINIEKLRTELGVMIDRAQEWCDAVDRGTSWDDWDHHFKEMKYTTLPIARDALSKVQS